MAKRIHAWEIEGCFEIEATVPDDRADKVACAIEGLCRNSYVIEQYEDDGFYHSHYDAATGTGGICFVKTEPQPPDAHESRQRNAPPSLGGASCPQPEAAS